MNYSGQNATKSQVDTKGYTINIHCCIDFGMQEIKVKRQRCLSSHCRSSIENRETNRKTNSDNVSRAWTCFRLPFCDTKEKERNHNNGALLTYGPSCTNCGVKLGKKDDEDDDDDSETFHHHIQPFMKFGNASTKLKLPSHFSRSIDESSTISTAAATSVGSSFRSQTECSIDTTEFRYVSLNSLLRPTTADDITSAEVCSDEFSYEIVSKLQDTINVHCICCQVMLSSHWKYCPSCGIYLDAQN